MKWKGKDISNLLVEVKRATGGEADSVARILHGEFLGDTSRVQFFSTANEELDLSFMPGDLRSWDRRLIILPMRVPPGTADPSLHEKLLEPDVLGAIAVASLRAYFEAVDRGTEKDGFEDYTQGHLLGEKRKVLAGKWADALKYIYPSAGWGSLMTMRMRRPRLRPTRL